MNQTAERTEAGDEKPRACIAVKTDRLTVYFNRPAILQFLEKVKVLAESNPKEHYEIHLGADLDPDGFGSVPISSDRVWTLVDKKLRAHIVKSGPAKIDDEMVYVLPYDLNLMMVSEGELDELASCRSTGVLPALPED